MAKFRRMAELFEIKRRHLILSFEHHYEVASIKEIEQENEKLKLGDKPDHDAMARL